MLHDNAGLLLSPPASIRPDAALGRLDGLAAPGEVFVGEHDDGDNRAIAETLGEAAGRALTLHVVAGAGHFPMLERPGWLPQVVATFLATPGRQRPSISGTT